MQRIRSVIARILITGMVAFPFCPMLAQAQGNVLKEHAAMHGSMTRTEHQPQIETHVNVQTCCPPTFSVAPAVEGKNGFSLPIVSAVELFSETNNVGRCAASIGIRHTCDPPDQKFERRSVNKKE